MRDAHRQSALAAFWPGLMVLSGADLPTAAAQLNALHAISKSYGAASIRVACIPSNDHTLSQLAEPALPVAR